MFTVFPQSFSLPPPCSALWSSWSRQRCVCKHGQKNGQDSHFHHEQGIFTSFISFSLLYTRQMASPVKPLFVKGETFVFTVLTETISKTFLAFWHYFV